MIFTTLMSAGCIYSHHHRGDEFDTAAEEEGLEEGRDAEEASVKLAFEPAVVTAGEDFLGYITVTEGDLKLVTVADVTFYGDVELASWDVRTGEIIVSLTVDDSAKGQVDLVLELDGGEAVWLEAAVAIESAGGQGGCGQAGDPQAEDTGCDD